MEDEPNETVTVATGGGGAAVTASVAEPVCPSLVAVICAEPAATVVTNPDPETVATAVLFELHVTVRPVSVLPLASFNVALACVPCPAVTDDAPSATVTLATGGGGAALTLMVADPVWPSLVAVIDAVPTASPFTRPLAVTLAIAALAD